MTHDGKEFSLMSKIKRTCETDTNFCLAHFWMKRIMMGWAVLIILDRIIGIVTEAYDTQELVALCGGIVLVFVAFMGTRGYVWPAIILLQVNLAVFVVQFAATCFFYSEQTERGLMLFYGIAALILLAGSVKLFLDPNLENYRKTIKELKK